MEKMEPSRSQSPNKPKPINNYIALDKSAPNNANAIANTMGSVHHSYNYIRGLITGFVVAAVFMAVLHYSTMTLHPPFKSESDNSHFQSLTHVNEVISSKKSQQSPPMSAPHLDKDKQRSPSSVGDGVELGGIDSGTHTRELNVVSNFRDFMRRKPNDARTTSTISDKSPAGLNPLEHLWNSLATTTTKGSVVGVDDNSSLSGKHEKRGDVAISVPVSGSTTSSTSSDSGSGTPAKLTRAYCQSKYGNKRFLPKHEQRKPPMLYTFPGSGNTWCRLLIEHATSVYTGSVYNDGSLLTALPGEFTCNWAVSAVKVHPHTHDFAPLHSGDFNSDANKCKRGGVNTFERAVLLIRNPYDSIWSEYQRRVTQSHVEGILKSTFSWPRWQANAANLAHQYFKMWDVHYMGIERAYPKQDILYIRYEDLKDKRKRVGVMREVVDFLHMSASQEKLECAFVLSNNDKAHRSIDEDIEMTKGMAYTEPLACRMWGLFGKYAEKHGYKPWGNYSCANPPALPMVNVGPRGEYNKEWVRPGQKLLDFGGHDHLPGTSGGGGGKPGRAGGMNQQKRFIAAGAAGGSVGSSALQMGLKSKLLTGKVRRPDPAKLRERSKEIVGMTMDEAMSVTGIGNLGEQVPVWQ